MATIYKTLAQSNPQATTNTDIYTVPAATEAVISTIFVCNTSYSANSFRIAIRPNGETLAKKHYIFFDKEMDSFESVAITCGITLDASDVVTVYAQTGNVSFSIFGSETT